MKPVIFLLSLSSMLIVGCASAPISNQINSARQPYFLPEPQGNNIKYPIVLAHGFNASPSSIWGFNPVLVEALRKDHGCNRVFTTQVSPFNSVAKRAEELKRKIEQILIDTKSEKVNIIAHSMGGLDARYLVSRLQYKDRVASITTISTPHFGTKIADDVYATLGTIPKPPVNMFTNFIGQTYDSCENYDCDLRSALFDMSENANNQFNQQTPDVDGVLYQSYAGISGYSLDQAVIKKTNEECRKMLMDDGVQDKMQAPLIPIEKIVSHGHCDDFRPNDGVVTVQSARWGKFLGCIPADHLAEVGQIDANKDNPTTGTDFNYIRLYRTLAFNLAEQGL